MESSNGLNGNKRKAANELLQPQQKYPYNPNDVDSKPSANFCQARWLIESSYCAKVLGPGGKRLRSMRETTREVGVTSRISTKLPDCDYRIFSCGGSSLSVSKMCGLFVKAIFDEPNNEHSDGNSKRYDLKLLIPRRNLEALVGINDKNLVDIEEKSHSSISYEHKNMANSDEVCVHLYGVADAIQISLYLIMEKLIKVNEILGDTSTSAFKWFEPMAGSNFAFTEGRKSDSVARVRSSSEKGSSNSSISAPGVSDSGNSNVTSIQDGPPMPNNVPSTLTLPPLSNDSDIPQNILTAYEIAKDSQKKYLRQLIHINCARKGTQADRAALIDNIRRVTNCQIELGIGESIDNFADYGERMNTHEVSLVLDGVPEDNMLALFLIYRFLRN